MSTSTNRKSSSNQKSNDFSSKIAQNKQMYCNSNAISSRLKQYLTCFEQKRSAYLKFTKIDKLYREQLNFLKQKEILAPKFSRTEFLELNKIVLCNQWEQYFYSIFYCYIDEESHLEEFFSSCIANDMNVFAVEMSKLDNNRIIKRIVNPGFDQSIIDKERQRYKLRSNNIAISMHLFAYYIKYQPKICQVKQVLSYDTVAIAHLLIEISIMINTFAIFIE